MTTDTRPVSPADIASAGEYVLGTLPLDERQALQQRLAREPALAEEVARWESHFDPLSSEISPVTPPAHIWQKIEARLFADQPAPARAGQFWRWLGIGASLSTAALAALLWMSPPVTPVGDDLWVSDMVSADGDVRLAAIYNDATGEMRVSMGGKSPDAGRDFELWLIEEGKTPISLGVMPRSGQAAMPIPDTLRPLVVNATLAITDEPEGGSPQGIATGPVVAAAPLRQI